jgi:6-phosphogluconate dehydrogenase (decarboxylating)
MGGHMRDRLRAAGIEVLGYSRTSPTRDVTSLAEMVDRLSPPRAIWIMVPAGEATRNTVTQLADLLGDGDVVIDGGNSPTPRIRHTRSCSPITVSGTWTAGSPVVYGAGPTATG